MGRSRGPGGRIQDATNLNTVFSSRLAVVVASVTRLAVRLEVPLCCYMTRLPGEYSREL